MPDMHALPQQVSGHSIFQIFGAAEKLRWVIQASRSNDRLVPTTAVLEYSARYWHGNAVTVAVRCKRSCITHGQSKDPSSTAALLGLRTRFDSDKVQIGKLFENVLLSDPEHMTA